MADIFGSLEKDSKIKIKRSNGVVHQATVTSLVPGNLTVNVEVSDIFIFNLLLLI